MGLKLLKRGVVDGDFDFGREFGRDFGRAFGRDFGRDFDDEFDDEPMTNSGTLLNCFLRKIRSI
tara:strand:+ start:90 stop:281 length:192 start_codon:yes stop_codon:yes gene_type:complete